MKTEDIKELIITTVIILAVTSTFFNIDGCVRELVSQKNEIQKIQEQNIKLKLKMELLDETR